MASVLANAWRAKITGLIIGTSATVPKYLAWGTGAGTSAATDTTLFTEDTTGGYARVASTMSQITTAVTNDTVQSVGTITAAATLTITNMGLFDASTSGNLYLKTDFTGVALSTGEGIQMTFTHQLS